MDNLTKEEQTIAAQKVIEEMKKAEEYVKSWNACWYEQLLDAHCLPLQKICEADIRDMERKYGDRYKLANAFYSKDSIVPLTRETIVGDNTLSGELDISFNCEFGRIDWYGMTSNKSKRIFSFVNNGKIYFSKDVKRMQTPQHPKNILYDASYNVLSNNFNINITLDILLDKLAEDLKNKYRLDYITLSLNGNILTKKYNDIEINEDLNTGIKRVKIVKEFDKQDNPNDTSIAFESIINSDDSLEKGSITVYTHKSKGKINGTYRFDVSREKGIHANFYSRKGNNIDLTTDPVLLENAYNFLSLALSTLNSGDVIISDFANSLQTVVSNNQDQNVINFDSLNFNMENVKQIEKKVIELVKSIKGELPLFGLVERINNCLDLINNKNNLQIDETPKALRLEANN